MPPATRLAAAFGLPTTDVRLEPVQHSDLPTWRMITNGSRHLVKRLVPGTKAFPRADIEQAMDLERAAAEAGIRTAEPLAPVRPTVGWCTKIDDHGWFRGHAWVEHRPLADSDDITTWLGQTLATLHRLQPSGTEPDWASLGLIPAETWSSWIEQAVAAGYPWATHARERLPYIETLTERLRALYARVPDPVVTHADVNPHNVLLANDGPVLIDWDTVWPSSAALQVGQVALKFGNGRPDRVWATLDAYRDAGGDIDWPAEGLFLGEAAHKLAALGIRIPVILGHREPPRWIDPETADRRIHETLQDLPELVDYLIDLARG